MSTTEKAGPLHPRRPLIQVLEELERIGICEAPTQVEDKFIVCIHHTTWFDLARECSKIANGLYFPHHSGMRWKNGNQTFYVVAPQHAKAIIAARNLVYDFCGIEPNWSVGACARSLLEWALMPGIENERDAEFLAGNYIGYRRLKPVEQYHGVYFDAKSCYYQLISRLPSPRLNMHKNGKIRFHPMLADEKQKWQEVLELVRDEKLLRNSMWGAMLGSSKIGKHFYNGQLRQNKPYSGTHYPAAALVGRTAWELCQQADIDTDANYAHTDGIIVTSGATPETWDKYGIAYGIKAKGLTHINAIHSASCGGWATEYYSKTTPFPGDILRPAVPSRLFHQEWL